jgi:ABC-type uncharacterized transport system permease subunit
VAKSSNQAVGRSVLLRRLLDLLSMPTLALITAFVLGAVVIFITSGRPETVGEAYAGLVRGAFIKQRGLSESLVAMIPYVFLALGVALGFKAGLFNIGVEGQFYMGALSAAWAGQAVHGLPALIHLPLVLLVGALGGALWAGIPGYLKAKTGAHEVISTMMMNYVAFRLTEFIISGPLRASIGSTIQTPRISPAAELWALWDIPNRLADPLNALGVGLVLGCLGWVIARAVGRKTEDERRATGSSWVARHSAWLIGVGVALVAFLALPPLTRLWWPFTDEYDRLHLGLVLAVLAALVVFHSSHQTTIAAKIARKKPRGTPAIFPIAAAGSIGGVRATILPGEVSFHGPSASKSVKLMAM